MLAEKLIELPSRSVIAKRKSKGVLGKNCKIPQSAGTPKTAALSLNRGFARLPRKAWDDTDFADAPLYSSAALRSLREPPRLCVKKTVARKDAKRNRKGRKANSSKLTAYDLPLTTND
ncbi:MAG: hypothetical protein MUD08_13290 [Cytophagales bacterium]|nr:hypothetical protein [Cytophagales bacterium]